MGTTTRDALKALQELGRNGARAKLLDEFAIVTKSVGARARFSVAPTISVWGLGRLTSP